MGILSFKEAILRCRFTEHGRMLLDIVRKNPGIHLETLVREHDPPSIPLMEITNDEARFFSRARARDALRGFSSGGHGVRQLCDAGCLVITEELRVYRPEDVPEMPSRGAVRDLLDEQRRGETRDVAQSRVGE